MEPGGLMSQIGAAWRLRSAEIRETALTKPAVWAAEHWNSKSQEEEDSVSPDLHPEPDLHCAPNLHHARVASASTNLHLCFLLYGRSQTQKEHSRQLHTRPKTLRHEQNTCTHNLFQATWPAWTLSDKCIDNMQSSWKHPLISTGLCVTSTHKQDTEQVKGCWKSAWRHLSSMVGWTGWSGVALVPVRWICSG